MGATTAEDRRPAGHDEEPHEALDEAAAFTYAEHSALRPSTIGPVGLELEAHLVDLDAPDRRLGWDEVHRATALITDLPGGSVVTVEPGGQVELSGPVAAGVAVAVRRLQSDVSIARSRLAAVRTGLAALGTDPVRPPLRVNDGRRYVSMEQHFDALGHRAPGRAMMCSTASLQVNLEAGPPERWHERVARAERIGPVLVAVSACSPWLAGARTGWRSTRQRIWSGLDPARCGPVLTGSSQVPSTDPSHAWAHYAMAAPVMMVHAGDAATGHPEAVTRRVPFRDWASGAALLGGRRPTTADLGHHLTTLFPPTRLRGFLEIRCVDASPAPWWGALAALVTTLMDDDRVGAVADEACEPVRHLWGVAARDGLDDAAVHRAAVACTRAAAGSPPSGLAADLARLADLVASGRSPGDAVACSADPVATLLAATSQENEDSPEEDDDA